jgi:FMN phosphatase YigB (HAD superfamily)
VVLGKPDPGMLEEAARRAGVELIAAMMVGDRLNTDILMARRAGALAVHITDGSPLPSNLPPEKRPHLQIRDLGELADHFRRRHPIMA